MKRIFYFSLCFLFIACNNTIPGDNDNNEDDNQTSNNGSNVTNSDLTSNITINDYDGSLASDASLDVVDATDDDYYENSTFSNIITVTYSESAASVVSPEGVLSYISGGHVVIDLTTNTVKNAEIILSGTCSDGSLKVYSPNKYKITLNGVSLTSSRGPAINNQSKKRTFIHVANGTTNYLTDASSYGDDIYYLGDATADSEDRKGCLFSEAQLVFSGTGALIVKGNKKNAISTDDYLRMRHGVTLVATTSTGNAVKAKDSVVIDGGYLYAATSAEASKAISCDGDATINGGTILLSTSGGSCYDADENDTSSAAGIKCDGTLTINNCDMTIVSTGTGGKGLNVDTELIINGGNITIATYGGKYVYNSALDLTSSPKGVKCDGNITVNGGDLRIEVTGISDGSEGLESKAIMNLNGGNIYVYAYDDAINATTAINCNGANIFSYAVNNDGIDSNGTLSVSGGVVISSGTTAPEEGFDCDQNRFAITGGILIGMGGSTSTPTTSACTQRSAICNGISANRGDIMSLTDASGNSVMQFIFPRTYSSMCLLISSPSIQQSTTYNVIVGGSLTGATEVWNGYYTGGTYSGGSTKLSFTASNMVTTSGSSTGGMGGGGNFPGIR